MRRLACLAAATALACASGAPTDAESRAQSQLELVPAPSAEDASPERAADAPGLGPDDMPLRVAIGLPPVPARDGSRKQAREAAIDAMRMWENALQPHVAWFRLEFLDEHPDAEIEFAWKRRIPGSIAGKGGQAWELHDGRQRLRGSIAVTLQPYLPIETALLLEELRYLVTHEFGHVLGLGHCLDCDSAMNYAWHTRDRVFVTDVDVRNFLALLAQPPH